MKMFLNILLTNSLILTGYFVAIRRKSKFTDIYIQQIYLFVINKAIRTLTKRIFVILK